MLVGGRMGDFIPTILKKNEQKINAQIEEENNLLIFSFLKRSKLLYGNAKSTVLTIFIYLIWRKKCKFPKSF
jgi:hypothetical protein